MRPGQIVTYEAGGILDRRVQAIVLRSSHDLVTVEDLHELDEDGDPAGPFLGNVHEMNYEELTR